MELGRGDDESNEMILLNEVVIARILEMKYILVFYLLSIIFQHIDWIELLILSTTIRFDTFRFRIKARLRQLLFSSPN